MIMMMVKDGMGLDIKYEAWNEEKRVPFFLRAAYSFQYAVIEDCPCILLFPKEALANISVLKKHIVRIKKAAQFPIVFVLKQISEFRRKTFVENKLPFVVDGKMMYLPFIGTYMTHSTQQEEQFIEQYMPSAQLAFLYYLYTQQEKLSLVELSEKLPFSVMSVNRAVKQLVSSKLFLSHKEGVRIILQGTDEQQRLFERAKPLFKSPVRFAGYMDCRLLTEEFVLAGFSGLAEYTMLNPETCKTYAVKNGRVKKNELQHELVDERRQVRVEIWQYDPRILGKNGIADPLSLALSLQENHDERVEQAVEELLAMVWEDKNKTRCSGIL